MQHSFSATPTANSPQTAGSFASGLMRARVSGRICCQTSFRSTPDISTLYRTPRSFRRICGSCLSSANRAIENDDRTPAEHTLKSGLRNLPDGRSSTCLERLTSCVNPEKSSSAVIASELIHRQDETYHCPTICVALEIHVKNLWLQARSKGSRVHGPESKRLPNNAATRFQDGLIDI